MLEVCCSHYCSFLCQSISFHRPSAEFFALPKYRIPRSPTDYNLKMSQAPPVPTAGAQPRKPASQRIPIMAEPFVSEKARKQLDLVEKFVEEECIPADTVYSAQLQAQADRFVGHPPILEHLKKRAKQLGIWNMFLPRNHYAKLTEYDPTGHAGGYTNLEYGLMAEILGGSRIASEACNCAAPDTGNMEVIARYGTTEQKEKWLRPLLAGEIRSGFLMTEPDKASSDGSNISLEIRKEGDTLVLNGSKWWSSGAGDDRCKIFVVMGKDKGSENKGRYEQQSMLLVPADTEGIIVHRMLSVYGYDEYVFLLLVVCVCPSLLANLLASEWKVCD